MDTDNDTLFLAISDDLGSGNLASLKFLCIDLISQKEYENSKDALKLFCYLYKDGMLAEDNTMLLKELLFRIKRMDILKNRMGTSNEKMKEQLQEKARISPYRLLLFSIAEELTVENVEKVSFLLQSGPSSNSFYLPKRKVENKTIFEILLEMEKCQLLSQDNLTGLKYLLRNLRRNDLLKHIETFETRAKGVTQQKDCTYAKPIPGRQVQTKGPLTERRQPQKQVSSTSHLSAYKMGEGSLGNCLIINNYDFSKSQHKFSNDFREGTYADAEALRKIFKRLRFDVKEHTDLTAQNILDVVKECGSKASNKMYCFVCCILSHGDLGKVYGTDGQTVQIKDLTAAVDGQHCSLLADKPKVFFIQACQGNKGQNFVLVPKDSDEGFQSDTPPLVKLPISADFLIGIATVEDYESYRHSKFGSVYIQSLCVHLETLCKEQVDLFNILTKVNADVAAKDLKRKKQMPEIKSTLRKQLIFPVPLAEADEPKDTEDMDMCH